MNLEERDMRQVCETLLHLARTYTARQDVKKARACFDAATILYNALQGESYDAT